MSNLLHLKMDQKRSSRQVPGSDGKAFEEAGQKAPVGALEWMVYMFELDPWLEISYLIQVRGPKFPSESNRDQM